MRKREKNGEKVRKGGNKGERVEGKKFLLILSFVLEIFVNFASIFVTCGQNKLIFP